MLGFCAALFTAGRMAHQSVLGYPLVARNYTNPVVSVNSPDPGVLAVAGGFVVATSSGYDIEDDIFPIRQSTNLVEWKQTGFAFKHKPAWASAPFYAPEIHSVVEKQETIMYWLVYDAKEVATGSMAVGAAWSKMPGGPFMDTGAPIMRGLDISCGNATSASNASAIDSTLWQNKTDATVYLFFKNKCNNKRSIIAQQLIISSSSEVPSLHPMNRPKVMLTASEVWEQHDVEGPFLWQHSDWLYLFYSGSNTWFDTYAIGVARSRSVWGPWKKKGSPLAHTSSVANTTNTTFVSPGHNSVTSLNNSTYLVYHANKWRETGVNCARYMMVDELSWEAGDGWPRLQTKDQAPSNYPHPTPSTV